MSEKETALKKYYQNFIAEKETRDTRKLFK